MRPFNRRQAILAAAAVLAPALGLAPKALRAQDAAFGASRYFAETGHNLKDPFLERWELYGAETVFGLPLSEERFEEGVGVVQTFETMTLVFDPSLTSPWDVQGVHLPDDLIRELVPVEAAKRVSACADTDGFCQYFPDTGHSLSGRLLSFWSVNGDLPVFGIPRSEPFSEPGSTTSVQVFERAVLEDHGAGDVRVRQIGTMIAERDGLLETLPFIAAPPTAGVTKLVASPEGLRLRAAPDLEADIRVVLPDAAEFISDREAKGEWLPGYADGFAGWVAGEFLTEVPPLPPIDPSEWDTRVWQGAALSETNVRSRPTTEAPVAQVLAYGDRVTVDEWVAGEEVFQGADQWARIGTDQFVYARNIGRNAPVLPPPLPQDGPLEGRWIDVHLTQQLITAYEGREPAKTIVTTTGMSGWETPPGNYQILVRVANETMTSGAIGAEHYYKLEDVLFTQYFTNEGHAIHFAWWRTPETIGRPGSHGCLNVLLDDARFLWEWADIGTPIVIHY